MGVQAWYLKVIDSLAPTGRVGTLSIEGLGWGEVDYLYDIEAARKLTEGQAADGKSAWDMFDSVGDGDVKRPGFSGGSYL